MAYPKSIVLAPAREQGKSVYETGKPCKNGHIAPRLVSTRGCTQCYDETYREKNRQKYRYVNTFYQQFNQRRLNAIKKGIPFTITFEEIEQPKYCPVLGLELNYFWSGQDRRDPAKACIDKLIPSLGYIPGNVFVISWRANFLKSNASLDELEKILNYVRKNTNGKII